MHDLGKRITLKELKTFKSFQLSSSMRQTTANALFALKFLNFRLIILNLYFMTISNEADYQMPARYRKMENMHIVFWLMKDISWCMIWKVMGITMIIPTLTIAIIISWRTRKVASELAHNLAITLWITANSIWMISEFFGFSTMKVAGVITGKHLALFPFISGALILLFYYAVQRPREISGQKTK